MTIGVKYDSGKPQMGLIPPLALFSVADVMTFGAQKYAPNNWKYVDNAEPRYIDAALRHIVQYMAGEQNDPETGLPHLSHAICCLMFIVDLQQAKPVTQTPEPNVLGNVAQILMETTK